MHVVSKNNCFSLILILILNLFLTSGCYLSSALKNLDGAATGLPSIEPVLKVSDPINLQVIDSIAQESSITWESAGITILQYRISLSSVATPSESCSDNFLANIVGLNYEFVNLTPDTTYYFRVCSIQDGLTSKGVTGSFHTLKYLARSSAYPSYKNWNDYLLNNGTKPYNATQSACPSGINSFNPCINGALVQKVVIPQALDCARIKVTDYLNVFQWFCETGTSETILYSTDVKPSKGLKDLIESNQFKKNYVLIQLDGVKTYTSSKDRWWDNVIEALPDSPSGGSIILSNSGEPSGKIFTLSNTKSGGQYSISEDKISIVILKDAVLKKDTGTTTLITPTASIRFNWIEGTFDGNNAVNDVILVWGTQSRYHNIEIKNFIVNGFAIYSSQGVVITDFNIHHGDVAFYGSGNSHLLISRGIVHHMNSDGFAYIQRSAVNNVIMSSNTGSNLISYSHGTVFSNITMANNIATNSIRGFSSSFSLYHNILNVNSNSRLIYTWNSSSITYSQLFSTGTDLNDIYIANTQDPMKFTNNLVLDSGSRCQIINDTAFSPGLTTDSTCSNHGPLSNATARLGTIDSTKIFVGKVILEDSLNLSDILGLRLFSDIFDWSNFENRFRVWGLDGGVFPSSDNKGNCISGDCRIWDYRLKADNDNLAFNSTNTVTAKNTPFVVGATCPAAIDGNKVTTYLDYNSATQTFLTNATEILGDGYGNEDTLCQTNERCLYTPNFGAYQGEGDFYEAGTCNFQNGTVSNVLMYAYPTNGQ